MKTLAPLCIALLLGACNAAPDAPSTATPAPAAPAAEPAPTPASAPAPATEARQASVTGVIESIDAAAHTVSIAHDPVESLDWPGMTMTFAAPGVDLSGFKAGDAVKFEVTATGMNGTITTISKQ